MPRPITLTTDFGTGDWFVGTMKGVILSRLDDARIVDLTHDVPPGDIRSGAFALLAGYRYFPEHTVHVAVVDPGVGSDRPALAVETEAYTFIGPDNGVLTWALRREEIRAIHRLENAALFGDEISRTFHGRDIFAPVAAALAGGLPIAEAGPECGEINRLPWPEPERSAAGDRGEVVYIDRFGNAITNLPNAWFTSSEGWTVEFSEKEGCPLAECYAAVGEGEAVSVPGSTGFLEIAVNGGNARTQLHLSIGDEIRVRP